MEVQNIEDEMKVSKAIDSFINEVEYDNTVGARYRNYTRSTTDKLSLQLDYLVFSLENI